LAQTAIVAAGTCSVAWFIGIGSDWGRGVTRVIVGPAQVGTRPVTATSRVGSCASLGAIPASSQVVVTWHPAQSDVPTCGWVKLGFGSAANAVPTAWHSAHWFVIPKWS
jgi:hypothetical protein